MGGYGGVGIFNKSEDNINTWHRIYPQIGIMKRDFLKEMEPLEEEEITVVTLFCGRFHTLAPYMWQLANMDYDKKKVHLVFYCTSINKYYKKLLKTAFYKISDYYASARLVFDDSIHPSPLAYSEKSKDSDLHMENIPRLYKKAFSMVNTRYFFSLEDDQVSPSHIVKRFLRLIKIQKVASVCGIAFDRHTDTQVPVAFDFFINPEGNRIVGEFVRDRNFCLTPVGSAGFGTTIFDKERIQDIELTQRLDEASDLLGCDVTFGYQANKLGRIVLVDWDVRSYHIDSTGAIC